MSARNAVLALLVGVIWATGASTASADIINGDFQTGDLTGWTASAIDQSGNPTMHRISVEAVGGNNFAVFRTGPFAGGLFIQTLTQSFTVNAAEPFLTFDFSLPTFSPDPTGTGTSSFRDSFTVSVVNGTTTHTLLLVDHNGALADPFGTAPGTVALGTSTIPGLGLRVVADLSPLIGRDLQLLPLQTNVDDHSQMTMSVTGFALSPPDPPRIPEPSSLVLLGIGTLGLLGCRWRHRRRAV